MGISELKTKEKHRSLSASVYSVCTVVALPDDVIDGILEELEAKALFR